MRYCWINIFNNIKFQTYHMIILIFRLLEFVKVISLMYLMKVCDFSFCRNVWNPTLLLECMLSFRCLCMKYILHYFTLYHNQMLNDISHIHLSLGIVIYFYVKCGIFRWFCIYKLCLDIRLSRSQYIFAIFKRRYLDISSSF